MSVTFMSLQIVLDVLFLAALVLLVRRGDARTDAAAPVESGTGARGRADEALRERTARFMARGEGL
jgi:hypothetical protein